MFLSECPFLYDIMGGSLKIWFSNGCCCIRCHFVVKIALRFGTAWWYCVTKGKIRFIVLFRWPLSIRCFLNVVMFSSIVLFEEFALRVFELRL